MKDSDLLESDQICLKKLKKKIIEFTYNKELAVMKKYSHHSNNTNKPSFWPKKRGQRLSVVQKRL